MDWPCLEYLEDLSDEFIRNIECTNEGTFLLGSNAEIEFKKPISLKISAVSKEICDGIRQQCQVINTLKVQTLGTFSHFITNLRAGNGRLKAVEITEEKLKVFGEEFVSVLFEEFGCIAFKSEKSNNFQIHGSELFLQSITKIINGNAKYKDKQSHQLGFQLDYEKQSSILQKWLESNGKECSMRFFNPVVPGILHKMVKFYIREGIRVEGKYENLNELRELLDVSCIKISPLKNLCRNGTVNEVKAELSHLEMRRSDWEKPDETGRTLLVDAVIGGNVDVVRFFVEDCTPGFIETREKNGKSLLNLAAFSTNKKEIFDIILNHCDPTFKDSTMNGPGGSTPLFDAMMVGNVVAIESLLENTAPEGREIMIGGSSILHHAVEGSCIDVIPALLKNSRPEFRESIDEIGNNALFISLIVEDNPKMISALLQNCRPEFLMTMNKNATCLGLAAARGRIEALKVLLIHAPLELFEYQVDRGVTLFHVLECTLSPEDVEDIAVIFLLRSRRLFNLMTVIALRNHNFPVVKALFETLSKRGHDFVFEESQTPIHLALRISLDSQFVLAVLDLFQNPELKEWYGASDNRGCRPLHIAVVLYNDEEIFEYIYANSPTDIFHARMRAELTPLGIAVVRGNVAAVEWFFKKWPEECLNVRFQLEGTILHLAAVSNSVETVKAIHRHVTPEFRRLQNTNGHTALMKGIQQDISIPVVHALLDGQPDLKTSVGGRMTPIHLAVSSNRLDVLEVLLTGLPLKYHNIGWDGSLDNPRITPILACCYAGHMAIFKYLLKTADLSVHDARGHYAIHIACVSGHLEIVEELVKQQGHLESKVGDLPLHMAAITGHVDIVQYLLKVGKPEWRSFQDKLGRTPLHHAALKGKVECVKLLLDGSEDVYSYCKIMDKGGKTAANVTDDKVILGALYKETFSVLITNTIATFLYIHDVAEQLHNFTSSKKKQKKNKIKPMTTTTSHNTLWCFDGVVNQTLEWFDEGSLFKPLKSSQAKSKSRFRKLLRLFKR